MDKKLLDLYTDYLISSFSYTTATWLSDMLDWAISHDRITRFLWERDWNNTDLWTLVKPIVREKEEENGVLIFDDSIEEKKYTDQNEIITWHFDHTVWRSVKGVNFLSCIYATDTGNIPVSLHIVKKDTPFTDPKTKKTMMISSKTKNEGVREMFLQAIQNQIHFTYALADTWFSCKETLELIHEKWKYFIVAIKENRTVSLCEKGPFKKVSEMSWKEYTPMKVFLKWIGFPVLLIRKVFTNKDGSIWILYLVSNDLSLEYDQIVSIYHKRWNIEVYHKSLKSNTGFQKSPGKTLRTQSNHFFASVFAYVKLECLSLKTSLNHFALKNKLYIKALQTSFTLLREMKSSA